MEQMKEELGQMEKVELEVVKGQLVYCEGNELAPSLATLGTRDVEILEIGTGDIGVFIAFCSSGSLGGDIGAYGVP